MRESRHAAALDTPATHTLARATYLALLTWAFTLFNLLRVLAYLPTPWAIHSSGDASQHSMLTWLTWFGANLTMAGWLHEHNNRRFNRVILVNLCNAAMCLSILGLVAYYRS